MSDYPRPKLEQPIIFPVDRWASRIWTFVYTGAAIYSLGNYIHYARQMSLDRYAFVYPVATLSVWSLLLWLTILMGRSRRGAFTGLVCFVGFLLLGNFVRPQISAMALHFPIWAYCVARRFGLLGPKPLRRGT